MNDKKKNTYYLLQTNITNNKKILWDLKKKLIKLFHPDKNNLYNDEYYNLLKNSDINNLNNLQNWYDFLNQEIKIDINLIDINNGFEKEIKYNINNYCFCPFIEVKNTKEWIIKIKLEPGFNYKKKIIFENISHWIIFFDKNVIFGKVILVFNLVLNGDFELLNKNDILYKLNISFIQWLCGFEIWFDNFNNEKIYIKNHNNIIKNNQVFIINNQGLFYKNKKGILYICFNIIYPLK